MEIERIKAQFSEYREWAELVHKQTGKGLARQIGEIAQLRKYGGQCGISDYYWYRLYDNAYHFGRGAPDFIGWRLQQQFSLALNPRNAVLPAWDKSVFVPIAQSCGLPVAPVRACFKTSDRISEALGMHLRDTDEVAKFLRTPGIYPIFGKPAYSQQGLGGVYLTGYDAASDSLSQLNGSKISLTDFMNRLTTTLDPRYHKPECGYLFQEAFAPAPEIAALTNWNALCCLRIICLNGFEQVTPIRAFWKIAVPPNQVDNFSMGRYGNLLANVDLDTGRIDRVLGCFWPKAELRSEHPTSGKRLIGFAIPGWDRILEACRSAGRAFPLMKIHHWDFALTDRGPLIFELNDIGSTEAAQIHGHGLLTEQIREFLGSHGDTKNFPWILCL